jgi:hypothetical protein
MPGLLLSGSQNHCGIIQPNINFGDDQAQGDKDFELHCATH